MIPLPAFVWGGAEPNCFSITWRQHCRMESWIAKFASPRIDWTVLQAFRYVATSGSFRAASISGGISLNTLRARVGEAERLAGRPLLERTIAGVTVTADGRILLDRVEAMAALLSGARNEREAEVP